MFLASPPLAGRFFTTAPPGVKASAHEWWEGGTDKQISQAMTYGLSVPMCNFIQSILSSRPA